MSRTSKLQINPIAKWLFMAGLGAVLLVTFNQLDVQQLVRYGLGWVDNLGTTGAIAFIGIYILATVLFIPGALITLGGGALFGVVFGSIYVFVGATIGATLAFLIARYWLRGWVSRRIEGNARFKAIDQAIAREGFKIVLLTRLSPVFAFNLLNYGLGVTQVSLKDYLLGFIGMIPGTVMYVYIGSLAGNLAMIGAQSPTSPETQRIQWIIRIVGLVATVAVTLYVTRIAKKALDDSVASGDASHASVNE